MIDKAYFDHINKSLKDYKRALPFLIIDLDRLDKNVDLLRFSMRSDTSLRIVVKSLPSLPLLTYIMKRSNSTDLMVFHQPFLSELAQVSGSDVDVLLGKPMPIKTVDYFYNSVSCDNGFDPHVQIQWLIDTEERLLQYLSLAQLQNKKLKINIEIDVGLHRGGINRIDEFRKVLDIINRHPDHLALSGLMGYDPHIVKLPGWLRSKKKSLEMANFFYNNCKTVIKENFPDLNTAGLVFNGAGSPTIHLHKDQSSPLNDISAGSCLVKPTTFDIESLSQYEEACFIATPILKKLEGTTIPGLERFSKGSRYLGVGNSKSYFIYGGYWKANFCYPQDVKANKLFGLSTNQTMINGGSDHQLEVDDFVFLRPQQSEFVMLQFGNILAVRGGEIIDEWAVLNNTL